MSLDVRIDKCNNPEAWYRNHIGKTFICESAMSAGGVVVSDSDPNQNALSVQWHWFIPFEDCTILNVTGMPPFKQEEFTPIQLWR